MGLPMNAYLSAITRLPLCNPAFLQVTRDRQGRSNAFLQPARINARTSVVATGKVCQQPVADKAMGLPVGAAGPIERSERDLVRRPTDLASVTGCGHEASVIPARIR
jgi:hypothetical protein